MWRKKKLIIIAVLAAVVLVGTIGGVAFAQTEGGDNNPQTQSKALMNRACEIYEENTGVAIDQEAFREAMSQAQDEMQAAAMESRLDKMVENGVIDEAQAQELLEWWQSRPDVSIAFGLDGQGMGFGGHSSSGPPQ
jgi:hypothetical protein